MYWQAGYILRIVGNRGMPSKIVSGTGIMLPQALSLFALNSLSGLPRTPRAYGVDSPGLKSLTLCRTYEQID